jgi:Zn-dependent protease with chaperone function
MTLETPLRFAQSSRHTPCAVHSLNDMACARHLGTTKSHSPAMNPKIYYVYLCILFLNLPLSASAAQPPIDRHETDSHEVAQKSPEREQLEPVAVPEPSKLAMQFYRSSNWLWVLNVLWGVWLPGVLAFSGISARLRNVAVRVGRVWFFTIGLYVVMYLALVYLLDLPLAYLEGYLRLHAYGLSNQSLHKWFGDSVIRLLISMAVGFALAWVPYLLMARSPKRWWIYTTLLSVPFLFAGMLIKPIWIDPLFNRFGPMKNQALEQKILALAGKAEIEGSSVFEVEKSVDTKAVNAYVTGVLATKRIVLWDTLLAKLDEKEVLHVMGHEMGHYVLGHVARSIVLSAVLTLIGLFLVDWCGRRLLARYFKRLGIDGLADVASLPLLLMLLEVAMLVLSPAALAYSRIQEREADKFALELTHDNHAGAHSFLKLMEENLSNPRPGPIYKFFRSSHPSIGERIDFCNSYRPWMQVERPPANSQKELSHGSPRSH